MDSIGPTRRQLSGQSGALVASAAVWNNPLLTQAFAAQPGEEIIPWSDQPSLDPEVARGVIQNLQRWEDLDLLTPNSRSFNIAHYNRPKIDEQDWSLEITGLVRKPARFRLSDIKARPRDELTCTLECSGNNGRPSFLTGIGTARWAGTSLAAMLREAELLDSSIEVVFVGADTGEEQVREIKMPTSFARSMGVGDAMSPNNLLCYEMNGAPLPPEHGFPLRLIAPGWYGIANVKWLRRIEVRATRLENRFMGRDYVTIREEKHDGRTEWVETWSAEHRSSRHRPESFARTGVTRSSAWPGVRRSHASRSASTAVPADRGDRSDPPGEIRMALVVVRLARFGTGRARHHRARHRRRRQRAARADGPADCRQAHLLGKQRTDYLTHPPVLTPW